MNETNQKSGFCKNGIFHEVPEEIGCYINGVNYNVQTEKETECCVRGIYYDKEILMGYINGKLV